MRSTRGTSRLQASLQRAQHISSGAPARAAVQPLAARAMMRAATAMQRLLQAQGPLALSANPRLSSTS